MIGSSRMNAASPACGSSSVRICSGQYAVDEIASGESAPSATGVDKRSLDNSWVISGLPRKTRLHTSEKDGGMSCSSTSAVTTTSSKIQRRSCSTVLGAPHLGQRIGINPCDTRLHVVGHDDRGRARY